MTDHDETDTDVEGDPTNEVLLRVGLMALMYYPEIQLDDPGFDLASDVAWALEPVDDLVAGQRDTMTDLVSRTVLNPTAYREELLAALYALTPAEG
jgi:hypothetical protein